MPGRTSPEAAHHRARIGGMKRRGVPPDDPRYVEAREALRAQIREDHIKKLVDEWPPLSEEQKTKLVELLRPVQVGPDEVGIG